MGNLVAATAAFLATHLISSTPLRGKLVAAIGEWPYRGLYSLVAAVTLGWMIWAYATALHDHLWQGPRWPPYVAMPFALVLIACGYWRNPTMVGADRLLKSDDPARGVIRITRHPIMWGVMLWAASHIWARGDLKAVVFFGAFLLLAGVGTLPPNFVVYGNDRDVLVRQIETIRTRYDPKAVFDSFIAHHRRFIYGDLEELKGFIEKLRTGAIHSRLHERHPTLEALADAVGL